MVSWVCGHSEGLGVTTYPLEEENISILRTCPAIWYIQPCFPPPRYVTLHKLLNLSKPSFYFL